MELRERPPADRALQALLRSATTTEAATARIRGVVAEQAVELAAGLGLAAPERRAGRIATAVLGTPSPATSRPSRRWPPRTRRRSWLTSPRPSPR